MEIKARWLIHLFWLLKIWFYSLKNMLLHCSFFRESTYTYTVWLSAPDKIWQFLQTEKSTSRSLVNGLKEEPVQHQSRNPLLMYLLSLCILLAIKVLPAYKEHSGQKLPVFPSKC